MLIGFGGVSIEVSGLRPLCAQAGRRKKAALSARVADMPRSVSHAAMSLLRGWVTGLRGLALAHHLRWLTQQLKVVDFAVTFVVEVDGEHQRGPCRRFEFVAPDETV